MPRPTSRSISQESRSSGLSPEQRRGAGSNDLRGERGVSADDRTHQVLAEARGCLAPATGKKVEVMRDGNRRPLESVRRAAPANRAPPDGCGSAREAIASPRSPREPAATGRKGREACRGTEFCPPRHGTRSIARDLPTPIRRSPRANRAPRRSARVEARERSPGRSGRGRDERRGWRRLARGTRAVGRRDAEVIPRRPAVAQSQIGAGGVDRRDARNDAVEAEGELDTSPNDRVDAVVDVQGEAWPRVHRREVSARAMSRAAIATPRRLLVFVTWTYGTGVTAESAEEVARLPRSSTPRSRTPTRTRRSA